MTSNDLKPLVVDLDGTLIRSDVLVESFLLLIKQNPLYILSVLYWLFSGGKAFMKHEIARRVEFYVDLLPYNQILISYIKQQKALGRKIVLATASDKSIADKVAQHLDLFDAVYASENGINLSGPRKRAALTRAFGANAYVYAGNAAVDLAVWKESSAAIVVGSASLANKAKILCALEYHVEEKSAGVKVWLKALRVHQWVKNALIFVPLLAAHQVSSGGALVACALAFISFSLCASSVYLLNDLLDLPDDRRHKTKRNRPLAAGTLNLIHGLLAAPMLLVVAFLIAMLLPVEYFVVLASYYILTVAYSFYLKRVVLIDVVTLASLYTIRIVAGAAAISVALSFWLLAFSVFLFLSLAILKRYTELLALKESSGSKAIGRGYQVEDIELLSSLGGSSGYISVLVLALYINSGDILQLYSNPMVMWPTCLVMLYWVSRVWIIAHRGQMHDDPIVFAIKDKVSVVCGATIGAFMVAATL
ncbi:MAG: hypothetical protein COA99_07280 [Moraxellaceae bacterium]|nr:MAG: hypothetical protein COA99_07280 [Moraxellaceae bacterium]